MNKEKLTYLSPETETLVVQAEGNVLQGPSDPKVMMALQDFTMTRGGYGEEISLDD